MHFGGVSGAANHLCLYTPELVLEIREGLEILLTLPVSMVEDNNQESALVLRYPECSLLPILYTGYLSTRSSSCKFITGLLTNMETWAAMFTWNSEHRKLHVQFPSD